MCHYVCVQPVSAAAYDAPLGEDESYSAENLRRIARSLSGTVIGGRVDVPQSRSFVSVSQFKVNWSNTQTTYYALKILQQHLICSFRVLFLSICKMLHHGLVIAVLNVCELILKEEYCHLV